MKIGRYGICVAGIGWPWVFGWRIESGFCWDEYIIDCGIFKIVLARWEI